MNLFDWVINLMTPSSPSNGRRTTHVLAKTPPDVDEKATAEQNADYQKLFNRMLQQVNEAAEVTNTSPAMAKILLELNQWNTQSFYDAFFENGSVEELCRKLGIQTTAAVCSEETLCGICYSNTAANETECGHRFCQSCWNGYIEHAMKNAPKTMTIICPGYQCNSPVQDRFIMAQIGESTKLKQLYVTWTAKRFVDSNCALGWCECERYLERPGLSSRPLRCRCGSLRCGNCSEEWHEPLDCALMKKWKMRQRVDGDTMLWLKSNAKLCPKCKCAIQKNGGCNKVVCIWMFCRYEFCWLCLQAWSSHENQDVFLCRSTNPHRLEWNDDIAQHDVNCFAGFEKMNNDNCELFKYLSEQRERVLLRLAADVQFRIGERMVVDDVIQLITRGALFVKYAWVFLNFASHDEQKLFAMHLKELHNSVEHIKKRLATTPSKWTWSDWFEHISPARGQLQARYDCVRRFWKIGVEQNTWRFKDNAR